MLLIRHVENNNRDHFFSYNNSHRSRVLLPLRGTYTLSRDAGYLHLQRSDTEKRLCSPLYILINGRCCGTKILGFGEVLVDICYPNLKHSGIPWHVQ